MSASNLSIVFAPNLLCPAQPDLSYQMHMPTLAYERFSPWLSETD